MLQEPLSEVALFSRQFPVARPLQCFRAIFLAPVAVFSRHFLGTRYSVVTKAILPAPVSLLSCRFILQFFLRRILSFHCIVCHLAFGKKKKKYEDVFSLEQNFRFKFELFQAAR